MKEGSGGTTQAPAPGVANPPSCPRDKGAMAGGEVWLQDLIVQGERGSVKPPQQLLGKAVLGRQGDGVHTHAHTELVTLGLCSQHDPLGPPSFRQWSHASGAARSSSCLCLTLVITPPALMVGNILGPWRKWYCACTCCLMHLQRQR